jgi:hypothetical protein
MSALDPAVQAKLEEFGDVELELMTLQLVQWKFAGTLPPDDQERAATLLDRFLELALELANTPAAPTVQHLMDTAEGVREATKAFLESLTIPNDAESAFRMRSAMSEIIRKARRTQTP